MAVAAVTLARAALVADATTEGGGGPLEEIVCASELFLLVLL